MATLKYRPEIDGLRALAVLSVILFHANASWLPGGFVGVDIFFVLSGFLITSIINAEIGQGTFSFSEFYRRRIKRILPPLYVVMAVTAIAGIFILLPEDYRHFRRSAERVLIFISNEYFRSAGDYFGPKSNEMPLLHTWSLAVEEQFYFIWPAILIFITSRFYKIRLHIAFSIMIISFVVAEIFLSSGRDSLGYYSLLSRGGELLIGATLAILPGKDWENKSKAAAIGFLGILLMLGSFFLLGEHSRFPGVSSIPATLGAALTIWSFAQSQSVAKTFFSRKEIVHIGQLSYSLYLWHWPVLAFMRYAYGSSELPISWIIGALLFTYVASYFSYRLIENTSRKTRMSFQKSLWLMAILPALGIFILIKSGQVFTKMIEPEYDRSLTSYGSGICHSQIVGSCLRGEGREKILVVGDSHAAQLNTFFDVLGKRLGWSAKVISAGSCPPFFDFDVSLLEEYARKPCADFLQNFAIEAQKYEVIVFAGRWDFQLSIGKNKSGDPNAFQKLTATIDQLIEKGKKVVVVEQIPLLAVNPFRQEKLKRIGIEVPLELSGDSDLANQRLRGALLGKKLDWLDLKKLVLDSSGSVSFKQLYMDNNHMNEFGAKVLAEKYLNQGNVVF